jgi:hypothetical protein
MTMESHLGTTGTLPFSGHIQYDSVIALYLKQMFPGQFLFLIYALQFKGIEPNPAASVLADVDDKAADL